MIDNNDTERWPFSATQESTQQPQTLRGGNRNSPALSNQRRQQKRGQTKNVANESRSADLSTPSSSKTIASSSKLDEFIPPSSTPKTGGKSTVSLDLAELEKEKMLNLMQQAFMQKVSEFYYYLMLTLFY